MMGRPRWVRNAPPEAEHYDGRRKGRTCPCVRCTIVRWPDAVLGELRGGRLLGVAERGWRGVYRREGDR